MTFIDIVGFFASVKELAPLLSELNKLDLVDIYVRATTEIVEEQKRFLAQNIEWSFEARIFRQHVDGQVLNLREQSIFASDLTNSIEQKAIDLLCSKEVLHPKMDLAYEIPIDADWAKRIVQAVHRRYEREVFQTLLSEAMRLGLRQTIEELRTGFRSVDTRHQELVSLFVDHFSNLELEVKRLALLSNTLNSTEAQPHPESDPQHLTKINEGSKPSVGPGKMPLSLPQGFYQALYSELESTVLLFEQLQRDYTRELDGDELTFAVDFSEIYDFMYRYTPRGPINDYILTTLNDKFTLMPGAVGELLQCIEKLLPPSFEDIEKHPLQHNEAIFEFIQTYPSSLHDEERLANIYGSVERQLQDAFGELLNFVLMGGRSPAFEGLRDLMRAKKLSPVRGIQGITGFPSDIRQKSHFIRKNLEMHRPGHSRNNLVDTVDFAFTWLLNAQEQGNRKRYITIYTQSRTFWAAATSHAELRWSGDLLIRNADYMKTRTRLQEIFPSNRLRKDFVEKWQPKLRQLANLTEKRPSDTDKHLVIQPTLHMLNLYREFDEECRIPLAFISRATTDESSVRERAAKLYDLLRRTGEFKGSISEAYEVLKLYQNELKSDLRSFSPEAIQELNPSSIVERFDEWLD